jgi:hypothetical protein
MLKCLENRSVERRDLRVSTLLMLTFGMLALGCGEQFSGEGPTSPSATPPSPSATPQPIIPVTGPTLSGSVYEVTQQGLHPVSFGNVGYSVDGGKAKIVNLDTSGRYTISALPTGSRIRLTASSPGLQQTCAVYTVFEAADTVQDIKLVRSGTHDATCEGPTLSGVVFRIVDGEKRPLRDQRVGFYSAEQWGGWTYTRRRTPRAVSNSPVSHADQAPCWQVTVVMRWIRNRSRFVVTPMWWTSI